MHHITVPMMNLYIPRAGREALLREVQLSGALSRAL